MNRGPVTDSGEERKIVTEKDTRFIEIGKTRKEEVLFRLGAPNSINETGKLFTYSASDEGVVGVLFLLTPA